MLVLLAVLTHPAAAVEVGAGFGLPMAVHAVARVPAARTLSFELGASVSVDPDPVTDLTRTLLEIAWEDDPEVAFQQPILVDFVSVDALARWTFVELPRSGRITGGPSVLAGVSGRVQHLYYASIDPAWDPEDPSIMVALSEPTAGFVAGPTVGLALDVWLAGDFGVRWLGLARIAWAEGPDYRQGVEPTTTVTASKAWTIDAMLQW